MWTAVVLGDENDEDENEAAARVEGEYIRALP
jgi:hypothetical protein